MLLEPQVRGRIAESFIRSSGFDRSHSVEISPAINTTINVNINNRRKKN